MKVFEWDDKKANVILKSVTKMKFATIHHVLAVSSSILLVLTSCGLFGLPIRCTSQTTLKACALKLRRYSGRSR